MAEVAIPPHALDCYICGPDVPDGLCAYRAVDGDRIVVRCTVGAPRYEGPLGTARPTSPRKHDRAAR